MSVVSNPINQVRQAAAWTQPRNWAAQPVAAQQAAAQAPADDDTPVRPTLTAKNTASIAPQNVVAPTWKDALDTINPLQQLPVVGEIYRGLTGEKISGLARVAGGFLFGGLAGGLAAALVAAYAEGHDDQSPGEQLVAALAGDGNKAAGSALAQGTQDQSAGGGLTDPNAIPTVTITAQDAANLHEEAPLPPSYAREPAAQAAQIQDKAADLPPVVPEETAQALSARAISAQTGIPLRERLNQKHMTPGFSNTARPMAGNFIDRLPANAATRTLEQAQNLELLQGVAGATPALRSASVAGRDASTALQAANNLTSPIAGSVAGASAAPADAQHNTLPPELVRDMMMQALDKYQKLPNLSAGSGENAE